MKNEMWKRSLRRGAALVLALVMSLTITSCSVSQGSLTARERAREPEYVSKAGGKVHEAVPYSRRPYEHYDPAAMEQAMADYGCRPGQLASCKMEDVGTYLELHIEQGKVLEDHGASIGVVSGIAGLVRYTVEIRGESGHAGATPMKARKDPVPAMCRWIDRVTELAGARESCVATVGSITAYPGARNVICERVVFSLDLRSIRQEDLREIAELSSLHGVEVSLRPDQALPPCRCHEPLREAIKNICRSEGYSFMELMSGAGHDCMNFKDVCPTAMIFVPSEGGVSHRKEEFTSREDCARGAGVLLGLLLETAGVSDKID